MPEKKIDIQVIRTTTITITPDQVMDILRNHFEAPADARVTFNCGYDEYLREVEIVWSISERTKEE